MVFAYLIIRCVTLCLAVGFFVVEAKAFFDCLRRKNSDFVQSYKRSRNFWLLITGIAGIVGLNCLLAAMYRIGLVPHFFVPFGGLDVLGILSIVSVVAAGVYLADVKPALLRGW